MINSIFTPMEIDAIGEIMNISLGSSATAVSNMLDHRVDITTPTVSVEKAEDFTLGDVDPAIGVEIKYVTGLEGSNIMLLKLSDVRVIVDILMGTDTPEDEFILNDLTLSAVCEVMNQMMGAASTALSDFLGRMVNISTPQTFDLDDLEEFKRTRLPVARGPLVKVSFKLSIENVLQSEFINVMSVDLARSLVSGFGLESVEGAPAVEFQPPEEPADGGGRNLSQEEIEQLMKANAAANAAAAAAAAPPPQTSSGGGKNLSQEEIERMLQGGAGAPPAPSPTPAPAGGGKSLSQEEIERMLQGGGAAQPAPAPAQQPQTAQPSVQGAQMPGAVPPQGEMPYGQPYPYPPYGYMMPPGYMMPQQQPPQEPKVINTEAVPMPRLEQSPELNPEQSQNLDLIMSVPLEVTVEIGRTKRRVQDILAFTKGSLVILDKLAGDQVDLFVNGKCIARGDVVVIDDNFGIRISEILRKPELDEITQQQ